MSQINIIKNEKNTHNSKIKTLFNKILKRQPSQQKQTPPLSPTTPFSPPQSSPSPPSSPPSSSSSYTTQSPSPSKSKYKTHIQKVFNYIDENNDGKISPEELQRCVSMVGDEKLSITQAKEAIQCSNSNEDGFLSLEDFELLLEGLELTEDEKIKELRATFIMYSNNNDLNSDLGVITPISLKNMFSKLGEKKSIEDCKGMIDFYDVDGDGVLCFDEFLIMMNN